MTAVPSTVSSTLPTALAWMALLAGVIALTGPVVLRRSAPATAAAPAGVAVD